MLHFDFITIFHYPIATLFTVIILSLNWSTGPRTLPIRLFEPFGPKATVLPVDNSVDFESVGVNEDIVLAKIIVAKT